MTMVRVDIGGGAQCVEEEVVGGQAKDSHGHVTLLSLRHLVLPDTCGYRPSVMQSGIRATGLPRRAAIDAAVQSAPMPGRSRR